MLNLRPDLLACFAAVLVAQSPGAQDGLLPPGHPILMRLHEDFTRPRTDVFKAMFIRAQDLGTAKTNPSFNLPTEFHGRWRVTSLEGINTVLELRANGFVLEQGRDASTRAAKHGNLSWSQDQAELLLNSPNSGMGGVMVVGRLGLVQRSEGRAVGFQFWNSQRDFSCWGNLEPQDPRTWTLERIGE